MPAYVIFGLRATHDEAALKQYREVARPTIGTYGGKVLVARGQSRQLEGNTPVETVLLEFADFQAAQNWYDSEAYQTAKKLREGAADIDAWIVDGFTPALLSTVIPAKAGIQS